ncbi:Homeodomain-like protein [Hypomontagnella monticulosa]|nr:Homeodomain-like protein [Hypomontagnella monticulosa]
MEEGPPERSHRRGPWNKAEDDRLLALVQIQGPLGWVKIAESLGTRTAKQCRERYHQNLKATLNHSPITPEEGVQIERMVDEIGKRWAEIARSLNNRSDNAVKNWYNGGVNRGKRNCERKEPASVIHHGPPRDYPRYSPEQELVTVSEPAWASARTQQHQTRQVHQARQSYQARTLQQAGVAGNSSLPARLVRTAPTSPHYYHLGHRYNRKPQRDRRSGLPSPSTPRLSLLEHPPTPGAAPPPNTQASSFFDGSTFRLPPLGDERLDAGYEHAAPRSTLPPLRASHVDQPMPSAREFPYEHSQLPTAPSSPQYPQLHSPAPSPNRTLLPTARERKTKHKTGFRIRDLIS